MGSLRSGRISVTLASVHRTERIATFTHRIHIRSGQHQDSTSLFNLSMRLKMVYEWDNKRDECFNMYITENKSLEEIIAHFRDDKNFTPRYLASCTLPLTLPCSTRLCLAVDPLVNVADHGYIANEPFKPASKNGVSRRSTVPPTRKPL